MKASTATRSTRMMCGALLASVMTMNDAASAAPGFINVFHFSSLDGGNSVVFVDPTGFHTFGGQPTVFGSFYTFTVSSSISARPGYNYELNVDYANYGTGYYAGGGFTFVLNLTGIVDPAGSISSLNVKDGFGQNYAGAVMTHTANSIEIRISADAIIAGGDWMTVQWAVPAPGGLALLGLTGMLGSRRRRE